MFPFFHVVFEDKSPSLFDGVRQALEQNDRVLRHPFTEKPVYVVCDSPEGVAERAADFAADPKHPFDTNGMVRIDRGFLTIHLPGIPEIHDQIVAAVLPLLEQHECRIVDEFGRDHTDKYAGRWHELFDLR